MKFGRETSNNPGWRAGNQSTGLPCSIGQSFRLGGQNSFPEGSGFQESLSLSWKSQPTSDLTYIWLVGGWEQEELPPSGSKMQQRSGWTWITLKIP